VAEKANKNLAKKGKIFEKENRRETSQILKF